jgi:hypothetical protein
MGRFFVHLSETRPILKRGGKLKLGRFSLALILVVWLAACSAVSSDNSEAVETFTPFPMAPTSTETPIPTQLVEPSPTIPPTQTAAPILPTATLSQYATPALNYQPVPAGVSPSGRWLVWRVACKDPQQDTCLQFSDRDSAQTWSLTENELAIRHDLPYTFRIEVAGWSSDYRSAYLVTSPLNFEMDFSPVNSIIKFSLVNGQNSYLIPPTYQMNTSRAAPVFYLYGFSNNSQWLAYGALSGGSINFTLLDLYSNSTKTFSVIVDEKALFGDIAWSPEDDFFVFSVSESLAGLEGTDDFSVFLVAREDLAVKRIYSHGDRFLFSPEWVSNKEVKYQSNAGNLILNIETGEITEAAD